MALDEAVLRRRERAWATLADLFLDTEVRDGLPGGALLLLQTGYDQTAIETIFLDEVAPILHGNLKQVAGEWAGFDDVWLRAQILERRRPAEPPRLLTPIRRWFSRLRARPALGDFEAQLELVRRARALVPEARSAWAAALGALAALYFESPEFDGFLDAATQRLQRAGLSRDALRALVERDLYPVFRPLRVSGVDPDEAIGRAHVERAIAAMP